MQISRKMPERLEFEYILGDWYFPDEDRRPLVPVKLSYQDNVVQQWALLDSGADMNVMPFQIGLDLGLSWVPSIQDFSLLGWAGRQLPAKAIAVELQIGSWPSLKMAFAWSTFAETPLILGQWNFFQMVDICFLRSQGLISLELAER